MTQENDTIVAIATPIGTAALGIIRISGKGTKSIISSIYAPVKPNNESQMSIGVIKSLSDGSELDKVVLINFTSPRSYTGEDMAEISCHGGIAVMGLILNEILSAGARMADNGEFTKRAFLNGKMDLSEAEAVIDLIQAKSRNSVIEAVRAVSGAISDGIREVKAELVGILSGIEASIDFPEDFDDIGRRRLSTKLASVKEQLLGHEVADRQRNWARKGIRVLIAGKPNTGKSTLLNAFAKCNKAIVTDIPGTTTDIIEADIEINGFNIILTDTAGLRRNTKGMVEKMAIKNTMERIRQSDLVIVLFDGSVKMDREDRHIMKATEGRDRVMVINKCDKRINPDFKSLPWLKISAKARTGIDFLEKSIGTFIEQNSDITNNRIVFNERQARLAREARRALGRAIKGIEQGLPIDIISIDIKEALMCAGNITGEEASTEVIENIFRRFCVGK